MSTLLKWSLFEIEKGVFIVMQKINQVRNIITYNRKIKSIPHLSVDFNVKYHQLASQMYYFRTITISHGDFAAADLRSLLHTGFCICNLPQKPPS